MIEERTILGPPGTGKTQTNSNLIRNCIEDGIEPEEIACVSFTRKAAQESRERVGKDWGIKDASLPYFQTLHSMAFRSGGYKSSDVVQGADLIAIGKALGITFNATKSSEQESDFDTLGHSLGDLYMGVYQLSRSLCISLEECYRRTANYKLHWGELKRLVHSYENYKKVNGKIDFTDMIEEFVARGEPPNIEALFVDEAQDLSTLQWEMIKVLRKNPRIQIFTGDDDQAIMGFQGADVNAFLNATKDKEVLRKSYRLPSEVWSEAQRIVMKIQDRALKDWSPKEDKGSVRYHQNFWDVPLDEGEWCIMARTNFIANIYANMLREEGWVFSRNGQTSLPAKTYDAIISWEKLTKGEKVGIEELRNVYGQMKVGEDYKKGSGPRSKAFLSLDPEQSIDISFAQDKLGLNWGKEDRWHKTLSKIDVDTKNYILNALKRGDNVKNPRIKVSTIHSMKGGESDNILVIPDLSYASYKEYLRTPSIEHRVYYVAVTRAKQSLHIMEPYTERYYEL